MSDASTPAIALQSGALTLFGVTTGLDPSLLIAGFIGGLWAQSYQESTSPWKRVLLTTLAAIVSAYLSPPAAAWAASYHLGDGALSVGLLQYAVAVLIGLLAHSVVGPALIKLSAKKAEDLTNGRS